MARVTVPKVMEYIAHPFGQGSLKLNGVQYSSIFNANLSNTYVNCDSAIVNIVDWDYPGGMGKLREVLLGLTAEFQANIITQCHFKWQGRNAHPVAANWYDLIGDTEVNVTTGWTSNEGTVSGYPSVTTLNFNSVPFEIRMAFRTNHATMGIARIKNSSHVKYLYEIA